MAKSIGVSYVHQNYEPLPQGISMFTSSEWPNAEHGSGGVVPRTCSTTTSVGMILRPKLNYHRVSLKRGTGLDKAKDVS
eukprot:2642456-Amphidinium_carterae.1